MNMIGIDSHLIALKNLWYFIKGFFSITAERWKDLIEDMLIEMELNILNMMKESIEKFVLKPSKNLMEFIFPVTTLSSIISL